MKIRTKFSIITITLLGLVTASTALLVVRSQTEALEAQVRHRLDAVMEGASRVGRESAASRDRLMLVGYLKFLRREHPELALAEATAGGHTTRLGEDGPGLVVLEREIGGARPTVIRLGFASASLDAEVFRALRPLAARTLAIAAFFMVLGTAANFWLGSFLTRPIEVLAAATGKIARGDFDALVPVRSQDEIGTLSAGFNRMSERLRGMISAREDILHTLTHELRTPLNGLQGYLELWKDGKLPETGFERREALSVMMESVARMEKSLSGALASFKDDRPSPPRPPEEVWIDEVIREVVVLFAPLARSKRIGIALPAVGAIGYAVGDPEELRMVVRNLVSNAIKYTPPGGEIRLDLVDATGRVVFTVSDTGYGIPPDELPLLFTKFFRARGSRSRIGGSEGTGLGLSIAKKAVESLGGTIEVASRVGVGTTFTVTLPKAQEPRSPRSAVPVRGAQQGRPS